MLDYRSVPLEIISFQYSNFRILKWFFFGWSVGRTPVPYTYGRMIFVPHPDHLWHIPSLTRVISKSKKVRVGRENKKVVTCDDLLEFKNSTAFSPSKLFCKTLFGGPIPPRCFFFSGVSFPGFGGFSLKWFPRCWFQIFFIFTPNLGRDSHFDLRIFFRWVGETTTKPVTRVRSWKRFLLSMSWASEVMTSRPQFDGKLLTKNHAVFFVWWNLMGRLL